MKNNNTIKWRLKQVENDIGGINKDIRLILENHLPHLSQAMASLKTRVNIATGINVGAIIIALLLAKYL